MSAALVEAARAVWSPCDRDGDVCHAHRLMWPCPFEKLGDVLEAPSSDVAGPVHDLAADTIDGCEACAAAHQVEP